jgi:hypothetical protein
MTLLKTTLISLVLTTGAFAQGPQFTIPAPAAPLVSATAVGLTQFTTWYYMVVAHYPSGTVQSQIVSITNGNATLTSSNFNQISWGALPGALNYDVLQLPTNAFTGTCTCSVTTATTSTSFSDQGGSLSSYTIGAPALAATATWVLDNVDYAFPKMRILVGNSPGAIVNHMAEVPSGAALPAFSSVGDLFVLTGASGGCYITRTTANVWVPCTVSAVCANGSSPAVCGTASGGFVAVPAGTNSTLVVNTTAVTTLSQIHLTNDASETIAGTTCNTTAASLALSPFVIARTPGTSFTIELVGTTTANPVCVSYTITN